VYSVPAESTFYLKLVSVQQVGLRNTKLGAGLARVTRMGERWPESTVDNNRQLCAAAAFTLARFQRSPFALPAESRILLERFLDDAGPVVGRLKIDVEKLSTTRGAELPRAGNPDRILFYFQLPLKV